MNELTPIYEPLDRGIASLVLMLRAEGFNTIASCEGGGKDRGHEFEVPTIRFQPHDTYHMKFDRAKLSLFLAEKGYEGYYIKEVFAYQQKPSPWECDAFPHYLELEFWVYPLMTIKLGIDEEESE